MSFKTRCGAQKNTQGCGAEITMKKDDDGWHPYNADGTIHKCDLFKKLPHPIPELEKPNENSNSLADELQDIIDRLVEFKKRL